MYSVMDKMHFLYAILLFSNLGNNCIHCNTKMIIIYVHLMLLCVVV